MRLALFAVCLTLAAQDRHVGRGLNWYTFEKEAALGAQLADDVRARTSAVQNSDVQEYLDRIGARLAAQVPEIPFSFRFSVIADTDATTLNEPLALPGGYVFIPSGLFFATQDENEFAGMLAHAMAHIVERHVTRAATRAQVANQATIPLIYMGGWPGYGVGRQIPRAMLQFQRTFESEADALAVRILSAGGFDSAGLARYIGREQKDDPYSPFPPAAQRVAAIGQAARSAAPAFGDEFLRVRELLRNH